MSWPIGARLDHVQCGDPLGMAVSLGQAGVDNEAVAVLHQRMSHEAELRLLARSLAIEPRLRIGRRGMRLVGALLAMEIHFAIPSAVGGSSEPFLGASPKERLVDRKLFHRRPSLDQRAVNRKLARAEQPFHSRLRCRRDTQFGCDVALQKPIAVLGKCRVIPRRIGSSRRLQEHRTAAACSGAIDRRPSRELQRAEKSPAERRRRLVPRTPADGPRHLALRDRRN